MGCNGLNRDLQVSDCTDYRVLHMTPHVLLPLQELDHINSFKLVKLALIFRYLRTKVFNPIPYVSVPDVPVTAPSKISGKSDVFTLRLNNFLIVFEQIVFVHEKALVL